jgi:hypothetical protein
VVTFVAGQATGLGIALAIAWVQSRWHRRDLRAAEKRARMEDQFESVRRYTAGLQEFVHSAVRWMQVWGARYPGGPSDGWVQDIVGGLEEMWQEVEEVRPRPRPEFLVRDARVKGWLFDLEVVAQECHDTCEWCIRLRGDLSREDHVRFLSAADENVEKILRQMDDVLDGVEG